MHCVRNTSLRSYNYIYNASSRVSPESKAPRKASSKDRERFDNREKGKGQDLRVRTDLQLLHQRQFIVADTITNGTMGDMLAHDYSFVYPSSASGDILKEQQKPHQLKLTHEED
ncbi:hypothetical protein J6590_017516 [Homalodisca vitripennis]|nr:hypothetical protein J6590_017516 [Homalodisca vitripennis]